MGGKPTAAGTRPSQNPVTWADKGLSELAHAISAEVNKYAVAIAASLHAVICRKAHRLDEFVGDARLVRDLNGLNRRKRSAWLAVNDDLPGFLSRSQRLSRSMAKRPVPCWRCAFWAAPRCFFAARA